MNGNSLEWARRARRIIIALAIVALLPLAVARDRISYFVVWVLTLLVLLPSALLGEARLAGRITRQRAMITAAAIVLLVWTLGIFAGEFLAR